MRPICIIAAISLAVVSTMSCGGSNTNIVGTTFGGRWSGTFTNASTSQSGTMFVSIDPTGSCTGSATNTTLSVTYNLAGPIQPNGTINWTATGGQTGSLQGVLALGAGGHLAGTVTQTFGSTSTASTIDLTAVP